MEFSLFTETWPGGDSSRTRKLNPYVQIGGFELCIDRDGFAVHMPSRSFGFIRKSGFWRHRHRRGLGQPRDGVLVHWFRRHRRAFDLAIFGVAVLTVALFAGQFVRMAVQ